MVYILLFVLLILGVVINSKRGSQLFLVFLVCALWLIIGLRDVDVGGRFGNDTPDYVFNDFLSYSKMSFKEIFRFIFNSGRLEPLYVLISWLSSCISDNYSIYLLTWAFFPVIGIYRMFKEEFINNKSYFIDYRASRNVCPVLSTNGFQEYGTTDISIGFIVLFMTGLFSFYLSGIRQTGAMGILMWSFPSFQKIHFNNIKQFIIDKNLYSFLLCVTCAFLIHNSSIIFLFVFFLNVFKARWLYLPIVVGTFFLSNIIDISQIVTISSLIFGERFEIYGNSYSSSLSLIGFFIQVLLFLPCLIKSKILISKDKTNQFYLNAMLLGLIFQSLTGIIGEMFRISYFFSMFSLILVPRALKEYRSSTFGKVICFLFIIACLIYLFILNKSNLPEYRFASHLVL